MSTHVQHPGKPKRTLCGRKIGKGLVVFGHGPFGTCLSCITQYEKSLVTAGDSI